MHLIKATIALLLIFPPSLSAQSRLEALLKASQSVYPALKAKKSQAQAEAKGISIERSTAMPKLTASYQAGFATANNITGMFLPGNILPISGPPSETNSPQLVSGTATGLLAQWEPITFGQRKSRVALAKTSALEAADEENLAVFRHGVMFVDTYLDHIEAQAFVKAREAELERLAFVLNVSRALAENGLRPGTDSAMIKAGHAQARAELLNGVYKAEAFGELLRAYLDGTGMAPPEREPWFDNAQRIAGLSAETPDGHPELILAARRQKRLEDGETVLKKSLMPMLSVWGTGFARGSAIDADGTVSNPNNGFGLSRFNLGVGFQLSVSLFDFATVTHQANRQRLLAESAKHDEDQIRLTLGKEQRMAALAFGHARETLALANDFLGAAQYAYEAVNARYGAGLADLAELLQAQAQLRQAEAAGISAKAQLWKALLYQAAVKGDLEVFIEKTR